MQIVKPTELRVTENGRDLYWSDNDDLAGLMHDARPNYPRLPFTAEGGFILIALDVDGDFDEIVVSPPPGGSAYDLTLSARDIAHDAHRALEKVRSGKDVASLYEPEVGEPND